MKTSAFCWLSEPHKLMYPYQESILSVVDICDEVVVIVSNSPERPLEKEVDEFLSSIPKIKKIEKRVWPLHTDSNYDFYREVLQEALDTCSGDYILKFDADMVFPYHFYFGSDEHILYIPRINFFCRNLFMVNLESRDSWVLNKKRCYEFGPHCKISEIPWKQLQFAGKGLYTAKVFSDVCRFPINYDATFFTKERVVDHWKKIRKLFDNVVVSDEQAIQEFMAYQAKKRCKAKAYNNPPHPLRIRDRVLSIDKECWGYDNFGSVQ